MKSAGVTGAILGVYSPTNAPHRMAQAAQKLRDNDVDILGFYGLIYFGSAWGEVRDTQWAIDLAKQFGVGRVWLDCETDGKDNGFTDAVVPTPPRRVTAIRNAVGMVEAAGLKAGIYSGAWWWPGSTADCTEFSHLPLWHAAYPGDGREIRNVRYGGWTAVAIHQYTSSLNVCGRNRDANYVFMEEEELPDPRIDKLIAALGGEAAVDEWNARGNSLLTGYALEQQKLAMLAVKAEGLTLLSQAQANDIQEHFDNHAAGVTGAIPEHEHLGGKVKR
jgi:hypothetical protein